MRNLLWITGRLPHPLRSGDALYTAGLLRAAHAANFAVTVIGLPRSPNPNLNELDSVAPVDWRPVNAEPNSAIGSLVSALPKDAYTLYPARFHLELSEALARPWDWIVFDHARSGGALKLARRHSGKIAYVAHNVERNVRREVAMGVSGKMFRPHYVIDALKYGRLETKIVDAADAVLCITEDDAEVFRRRGATAFHVPPVYLGEKLRTRTVSAETPRRVLLLGSFDWVAKQNNLLRFLDLAGTRLIAAGIGIDIVGSIPERLKASLEATYPAVKFWGAVEDFREIAKDVRGGLIPEELGGGMKMKTLDYIFMRLPVFSLRSGAAGLPADVVSKGFASTTLAELASDILAGIDNVDDLDSRQNQAFDACEKRFSVEETASTLETVFSAENERSRRV